MTRDHILERSQVVPSALEDAFAFFAAPANLERITPAWLRFEIRDAPAELARGARLRYRLRLFGVPIGWRTEISEWRPPHGFTDVQRRGPFRLWVHTHGLRAVDGGTEVHDHVRYALFLGPVGELVNRVLVRGWVEAIFDHRARTLEEILAPGDPSDD